MRDDSWLEGRLNKIWNKYFSDVQKTNPIEVKFGRCAVYRFGSIKLNFKNKTSYITINGQFRKPSFPAKIIDHTLAHELVHYAQGFSSDNPRMHRYPHRGGVIDKELRSRGLDHLVDFYNSWVPKYRETIENR